MNVQDLDRLTITMMVSNRQTSSVLGSAMKKPRSSCAWRSRLHEAWADRPGKKWRVYFKSTTTAVHSLQPLRRCPRSPHRPCCRQ
jgi:hypothetical protein